MRFSRLNLLLGCLQICDGLAAQVLAERWSEGSLGVVGEAIEQARMRGPHPDTQATGRFSDLTRRLIAEDALAVAYRYRHPHVTTGHLLLAVLDSEDQTTARLTHPHTQRLARAVVDGLPGGEHQAGPDHELDWIELQPLMRTLTSDIGRVLPQGWTVRGSARSEIHLQTPDSHSESDYQIRPGWITGQRGAGLDRLQQVTQWMLEQLQTAVTQATGAPWPPTANGSPAPAHAHVIPDRYNARLQLGYGNPDIPVLRVVEPDPLIHMLVRSL